MDYILRLGVTTGSCAAAAAKAATLAALGKIVDRVVIPTPIGLRIEIEVPYVRSLGIGYGEACVVKDAGDDAPNDATHGVMVCARVEIDDSGRIEIVGGEGVGVATLPGLPVKPGEKAINPIPRLYIEKAVREALPQGRGARVEIWVPNGEKIAEKTENRSLGIVGGISIIGTTGIVVPYSSRAWLAATARHLSVVKSMGLDLAVVTSGRDTKRILVEKYGVDEKIVVVAGDLVAPIVEIASRLGIERVLVVVKPAKGLKLSIGAYNTHSMFVDGRIEVLTHIVVELGIDYSIVRAIARAKSVGVALSILESMDVLDKVLARIAERVEDALRRRAKGLELGSCVVHRDRAVCTDRGSKLLELAGRLKV